MTVSPVQPKTPNNVNGSSGQEKASNQHPNLWGSGHLSAQDTQQGQVGDCTYISAINSLAANNPNLLKNNISYLGTDAKGNDVYDVRLFEHGSWDDYDVSADTGAGAKGENGTGYGPIFEKALALANGGYNVLNQGSDPTDALQQLTGQSIVQTSSSSDSNQVLDAVAAGHSAVACASGMQSGYYDPATGDFRGSKQVGSHDINLVANHGYAVVGVSGQAPNRTVTLENPWNSGGHNEAGSPGNGSFGLFSISEQAFSKMFSWNGYITGQAANSSTSTQSSSDGNSVHNAIH